MIAKTSLQHSVAAAIGSFSSFAGAASVSYAGPAAFGVS